MSIPIIDQLQPLGDFPAVDAADVQAGNERLSARLNNTPTTAQVEAVVENKVDKIEGKGLSTNDYTTTEKNKLSGIEANANNYAHPTTAGNKHIPAGGAEGKILGWASDGTAQWVDDHNTEYSDATTSTHGLMSVADKTKLDRFSEYADHSATYNNNKIAINGYEHISKNAYGSKSNATGLSVMVNSSGEPEVMNTDTEGLSKYHDRDVVGAYISADGVDPLYNIPMNKVTYSSDGCVVDYDMPNLLPDMIIDTSDNNYVGVVSTYDRATGTITLVDGWWHKTNHVKGTPVGTGFWVQKTTKVWGINVNVGLPSGIKTNAAAIEAGLYNNGSTGQDRGVFDAVLLKGDGDYGVRARGSFYYGFLAQGSTVGYAYRPESKTNLALSVELGGNEWFVIRSDGLINRTVKSVVEKGTAQLVMGESVIIEAADNATLTLPQSASKGTIIEVFIASSNHVTFAAPNSETVWYQGGTAASASFTGVYNSLFRLIKYSDTQWLIFIQHMAKLNEVDFTSAEYDNVITTYNTVGTRVKNLCPINAATIPQGGGYIIDTDVCISKGNYFISWNGTATSGQSEIKFKNGNTEVASLTVNNATSNSHYVVATDDVTHITMFCNVENSISNVMIRDARTSEDYEPYAPNLQAQIKALEARIAALES